MRKVLAGMVLATAALFTMTTTVNAAPKVASAKTVCHRQHSKANRTQCEKWRKAHKLHKAPVGWVRFETNGKYKTGYLHYGDTTYIFVANGKRYVS